MHLEAVGLQVPPPQTYLSQEYSGSRIDLRVGLIPAAMGLQCEFSPTFGHHTPLGDPNSFIFDVVRNAICTHSHPNGLMGAILHSLTLATALNERRHPTTDDLFAATKLAEDIPALILRDVEVSQYWRPTFERDSGTFAECWNKAIQECRSAVQAHDRKAYTEGFRRLRSHR